MKIWIDADACPGAVKEIVFRAAERLGIQAVVVANQVIRVPDSLLISTVVVSKNFDAADDHIAAEASAADVVITADVPLASRVVSAGSVAIDPRGEVYDEENIGERLSARNLMNELRSGGLVQGGPREMEATDTHKFASALDRELTRRTKNNE
ncbi:MAG TPA: YaiI/YqxD family protein [Nitrospinae bacterium]|nr:YaiI/YqxD family protein [Nitrospinota bacterium]